MNGSLILIAIGFLLLYIAFSKKGGLVADFFVKLFSATPQPATPTAPASP